jgi:galactokinase
MDTAWSGKIEGIGMCDIVPSASMRVTPRLLEQTIAHLGHTLSQDSRAFFAPGRANLLGAHLDYNGGCVMPVALSKGTCAIMTPRQDARLVLKSSEFPGQTVELAVSDLHPRRTSGWSAYLEGALFVGRREWGAIPGFNIDVCADLPMAKGLSSSASIESVIVFGLSKFMNVEATPDEMIRLAHAAETEYVGVRCGILDQTAIFLAKPASLLVFDCTELTREYLPLDPDKVVIAVVDSCTARELATSAFNQRVAECTQALGILQAHLPGITCLRDVHRDAFETLQQHLPQPLRNRVAHVVGEVERTESAAEALRHGDLKSFGRAMVDAHESMRDLYEVSTPEIDQLISAAIKIPGCFGARLTGAGFGGCIVALVAPDAMPEFSETVPAEYLQSTGRSTKVMSFSPSGGPLEWKLPR